MALTRIVLRGWPGWKRVPWDEQEEEEDITRGSFRPLIEEMKARRKMGRWLQAISLLPLSLFLRLNRLAHKPREFSRLYPFMAPREVFTIWLWGVLFSKGKIDPNHSNERDPLLWKDTFQYRNTLHVSKNWVPAGNSLGKLLESPWEAPPFGHCCRHCLSTLWPWRAAQRRHSEATVLIARRHMVSSPTKKLPDCPCLGQFCHFCGTGRWPLA